VLVVFGGGGTGGHLYPALAIARALRVARPDVDVLFVGTQRGLERRILPGTGFPHVLLDLHPLYRSQAWKNWRTLRGLVGGWKELERCLGSERASLGVGTGGYAAVAALTWCLSHDIPYVLQEQNSYPGLTTTLFSRWAREIYLGFPEGVGRLPASVRGRALALGNPIQPPPDPRPSRQEARLRWGFPESGGRVLLVFGGSQGSEPINRLIDRWLAAGERDGFYVIWATGTLHYERYRERRSHRVRVEPYLSPIADAYAAADLAVARAGAMATAELCAWGIPSLLVPLPSAAGDHQTANARSLAEAGAARWIPEDQATPERLDAELRELGAPEVWEAVARAALLRARPRAAEEIAERIVRLIDAGRGA